MEEFFKGDDWPVLLDGIVKGLVNSCVLYRELHRVHEITQKLRNNEPLRWREVMRVVSMISTVSYVMGAGAGSGRSAINDSTRILRRVQADARARQSEHRA